MGGFNADALLSVYDRKTVFRPFSHELGDMMITTRSLNACRDHVLLDDELYLSYLLLIETNIEFAFRNDRAQKLVQDLIVELQGLLSDGIKNEVSEELTVLTKQLLFKSAADLIAASGSSEEQDFVPVLSSLSYQTVDCWVFEQQDISTWSTFLALDSLTLLLSTYPKMRNAVIWNEVDLGERIVAAILPNDGAIRRLHSDIFQTALQDCESLLPALNGTLPTVLAERLVSKLDDERVLKLFTLVVRRIHWTGNEATFDIFHFFRQFVKNQQVSTNNLTSYGADCFTSVDFAVFLQWISQWSDITQPGVDLLAKISLSRDQILHWKSMVAHIQTPSQTLENLARLSTILKTVRLGHGFRNLRLLVRIFEFLLSKRFPSEWPTLYANLILRNMNDYVEYSREHLFPLPAAIEEVDVDEEERIRLKVLNFLVPSVSTPTEEKPSLENPPVPDEKKKTTPPSPPSPILSSPTVMVDSATSTDISFVSACSPSAFEPKETMEDSVGKSDETIKLFNPIEEEPIQPEHNSVEDSYTPPTPTFFGELTEQEEEDYYLMMAEQKLNSTRLMFEMTLKQNETLDIFERTTEETMKERYQNVMKENERLRKELEVEKKNKAAVLPQLISQSHNTTASIFDFTTAVQPHPGHSGICLGCLSDAEEDMALHLLGRLADEWNNASFD